MIKFTYASKVAKHVTQMRVVSDDITVEFIGLYINFILLIKYSFG